MKALNACLAAAGACLVTTAAAQSANPVTLYGRVYVTVESVEAKGGTTPGRPRRNARPIVLAGRSRQGGPRRRSPRLLPAGDGIQAGRHLGHIRQSQHRHWTARRLGVDLVGRWDTPFKQTMVGSVDPWTDLQMGDITGAAIRQGDFSLRAANVVQYWSPTFADLQVKAMYVPNEGRTAQANPSMIGGSISYSKGDASLSYAYEKHARWSTRR